MQASGPVDSVYRRIAPIYDLVYGLGLQHGRRRAMARLAPKDGESILEVGVGTGLSALQYPPGCRVAAIDLSAPMLARARGRLTRRRVEHVRLCRMDAARLGFPDACFDAVYAPYVINVVDNPLRVAREMIRVCRPGGRLVLLNHFASRDRPDPIAISLAGRLATSATGVNWNLELETFLRKAGLTPSTVEPVNLKISLIVVCSKTAVLESAEHDVS
jgi:phosphatidylethanolamine/phosphatidyl-N-methylethanolamine N-methyltransferase